MNGKKINFATFLFDLPPRRDPSDFADDLQDPPLHWVRRHGTGTGSGTQTVHGLPGQVLRTGSCPADADPVREPLGRPDPEKDLVQEWGQNPEPTGQGILTGIYFEPWKNMYNFFSTFLSADFCFFARFFPFLTDVVKLYHCNSEIKLGINTLE